MINTTLPLTLNLAIALGVYMVAAGAMGLIEPDRWRAILDEFKQRPGLTYISGVFVFALGTSLILVHSVWGDPLAIVVSLIAWGAAIEGILLIAAPATLLSFSASFLRPGTIKAFAIFACALGALLFLAGVTGTAG